MGYILLMCWSGQSWKVLKQYRFLPLLLGRPQNSMRSHIKENITWCAHKTCRNQAGNGKLQVQQKTLPRKMSDISLVTPYMHSHTCTSTYILANKVTHIQTCIPHTYKYKNSTHRLTYKYACLQLPVSVDSSRTVPWCFPLNTTQFISWCGIQ